MELKKGKTFVQGVFMKVKTGANGRPVPGGVTLSSYAAFCRGVALVWSQCFWAVLQHQPDRSLIQFDQPLIAPTMYFSCRFDAFDTSDLSQVVQWPHTARTGMGGGGIMGVHCERTRGGEGVRETWGVPWLRSEVQSWKFVTCLVWHRIFLSGSQASSLTTCSRSLLSPSASF